MEKMINWTDVYNNLTAAAEQFPRNTHDGPFYTKLAELINAAAVIRDFVAPVPEPAEKQKKEPETCGDMVRAGYVRATTKGWDGKDYEGVGRCFPAWHKADDPKGKTFVRIYSRKYKEWCFLVVTDQMTEAGVPVVEYAFSIER